MTEIRCCSLDEAWLRAVETACNSSRHEVSPLAVVFDTTSEPEPRYRGLRAVLDESLLATSRATVETVANTLFPQSLWNPSRPRKDLFKRYLRILPVLRRDVRNRRGVYFERLINYPDAPGTPGKNQLDHIAETFAAGNHRRSALQATVSHPPSDLNHARQLGFPCLQQVTFAHNAERGALTVTGFYAMQYLFERGYGNYLGLQRLGEFMAHEMNLRLERVVCFASVAKVEVAAGYVRPVLAQFLPSSETADKTEAARV